MLGRLGSGLQEQERGGPWCKGPGEPELMPAPQNALPPPLLGVTVGDMDLG